MSFAQEFIGYGEDIEYKGYVIGTNYWSDGPIYRVYSADAEGTFCLIEYEGTSVEDCKRWIDKCAAKGVE